METWKDFVDGCVIVLGTILVIVLLAVSFVACVTYLDPHPHGSCKVQHWAGKTYYCDEYYPLPSTRP